MSKKFKTPLRYGFVLEGYRITEVLGSGSFGMVYLAKRELSDQRVVVKEYCPQSLIRRNADGSIESFSEDTKPRFVEGMKMFFEEAYALSRLNHSNIVQVTDIFRANKTVYMIMSYEQGKDLHWFIRQHQVRGESFDPSFMIKVFPAIASGLAALHEHSFLHLDVKPANILLPVNREPMLLDFGAVRSTKNRRHFSAYQTLTHGFAPPEQYTGEGKLGTWTDIYALGATMYACMVGKSPPPAVKRQDGDELVPVSKYTDRYPDPMLRAVDWALRLDYRERPSSVRVFTDLAFSETPD